MRNLRKDTEKNRHQSVGAALLFSVLMLVGVGCNSSSDSICGEFPAVTSEIAEIRTQIVAIEPKGKPSRRIASVASVSPEEVLDRREAWMVWGEKALKQTQWSKDALETDKRGRKAIPSLNEAGLSLVSFHGYLEQRKWKKATSELDRIEASLRKARKIACENVAEKPKAGKAKK